MRSYRIVIEYTDASDTSGLAPRSAPEHWDWHDLLAAEPDETVSFVSAEEIETPAGHLEDLADV